MQLLEKEKHDFPPLPIWCLLCRGDNCQCIGWQGTKRVAFFMREEFIFEWLQEFLFPWFLLYFEKGYVPAFGNRDEGGGRVRNEAINKPAQDNPLLWAFLLWHMLIYFRTQHIEVDCFGCSSSWFLAPVLASGVLGRVHLLPSSQARCKGAHQHCLPSESLDFCQVHGGTWVPGEVGGLPTPRGLGVKGGYGTKWIWKTRLMPNPFYF